MANKNNNRKSSEKYQNCLHEILKISLNNHPLPESFKKFLKIILSTEFENMPKHGKICLLGEKSDEIVLEESVGADHQNYTHDANSSRYALSQHVSRKSKSIKFVPGESHAHDADFEGLDELSYYYVPILDGGKNILGVLLVYLKRDHRPDEFELKFLQDVALILASVIEKNQLETQLSHTTEKAEASLLELSSHKLALDEHAIIVVTDTDGTITYANDKFCRISGYEKEELIGANHSLFSSGYHPSSFFAEMYKTISKGHSWHGEIKNRAKDGSEYWLDTTITPLKDASGAVNQYITIRTDITKLKQNECDLKEHINILSTTFDNFPGGISVVDRELILRWANPAFYQILKLPKTKFPPGSTYQSIIRFVAERGEYGDGNVDDLVRERVELAKKFEKHAFKRIGAGGIKLEVKGWPLPEGGFITTYMDITDAENLMAALEEKTSQALRAAEDLRQARDIQEQTHQHLLSSVNSMRNGFAIWDADDRLVLANDAYLELHEPIREKIVEGISHAELMSIGYDCGVWDTGDLDKAAWLEQRRAKRRDAQGSESEFRVADGRQIILANQVLENNHIISTFIDITAHRRREAELQKAKQQLEKIAYFDGLTGLANRAHCQKDLAGKFTEAKPERKFAIIQIDLDNFKRVNDTLGHAAGDFLLRTLGERLQIFAEDFPGITPYRWGGDEFISLVERDDDTDLEEICQELTDLIAIPTKFESATLRPTVSLGIARYPEDASDVDALMVFADLALYKTKELGRDGYQFFSSELKNKIDTETRIERDLRVAIETGQLELYYQPQLDINTGAITGFEGLLRWNHPELGLISPDEFLPVVEATDLAPMVGRHVFDEAMAAVRAWVDEGLEFGRVAVNLSPQHLKRGTILDDFFRCLEDHAVEPRFLAVEILESYLFDDPNANITDILNHLRDRDVCVELDDFGTGYASLSHLSSLPINGLKIDRSFICGMDNDLKQQGIVSALISLAKLMELRVVCEGVETLSQVEALFGIGKCSVQGYLVARPMRFNDATDWIKTERNLEIFTPPAKAVADGHDLDIKVCAR